MSTMYQIERLSKNFGGLKALSNINIEIQEGEIFGIIGPNGAGKTTLFNVMTGFYPPDGGDITLFGQRMTGKPIHEFCRRGIARTFQNIRIFSDMTVLDNLKVGMHNRVHTNLARILLKTAKEQQNERSVVDHCMGILEYLGIADLANKFAGDLSYGKQRRVEIGRALASDPKLILLDEPTAGMNPQETMELMNLINGIRDKGHTVVVIEHNMRFMMSLTERIAVLNFGELLALGTPDQIQRNPEVIEAYLGNRGSDDETNS